MKKYAVIFLVLVLCFFNLSAFSETTSDASVTITAVQDALSAWSLSDLSGLRQQIDAEITQRLSQVDHADNALDGLLYVSNGAEIRINGYEGTNTNLVIPAEIDGIPVTMIHEAAFKDNTVLTSVVVPDSITIIKDETFSGCKNLTSIQLSRNLLSVGRWAFKGCNKLSSIALPEGVNTLESAAFQRAEGLSGVFILPATIQALNGYTFSRCDNLSGVIIQSDLIINDSDFSCDMKFLYIKEGCNVAFRGKKGTFEDDLEVVVIPSSVTDISDTIFDNCPHLTIVTPAGSYAEQYAREHWIMCNTKDYAKYSDEYSAYLNPADAE